MLQTASEWLESCFEQINFHRMGVRPKDIVILLPRHIRGEVSNSLATDTPNFSPTDKPLFISKFRDIEIIDGYEMAFVAMAKDGAALHPELLLKIPVPKIFA